MNLISECLEFQPDQLFNVKSYQCKKKMLPEESFLNILKYFRNDLVIYNFVVAVIFIKPKQTFIHVCIYTEYISSIF